MLAAQVLGYVGEVPSRRARRGSRSKGYEPGDEIGRAGVEAAFESGCAAQPRRETIEVDPTGQQVGPPVDVEHGAVGDNVYLTIDSNVQRAAGDVARARHRLGAARSRTTNVKDKGYDTLKAPAGAAVVLDATTARSSRWRAIPTYPPDWWVGGISHAALRRCLDRMPASDYPLARTGRRRASTRRARRSSS